MTDSGQSPREELAARICQHLLTIYGSADPAGSETESGPADSSRNGNSCYGTFDLSTVDVPAITQDIMRIMRFDTYLADPMPNYNPWTQQDAIVITYGDSIRAENEPPLRTLRDFMRQELSGFVSGIHVLPFFPWSSDDGFSVIDYLSVNDALGSWNDISAIASDFLLMSDLVINHCSSRSRWFENFKKRIDPGKDYFIEVDPDTDLSAVVRPRISPVLRETETLDGKRHVWCTFSHDQIDLDFSNPQVLLEFVSIVRFYLDRGIRIFRLDAVAFLWKAKGTSCISLAQTHEIIRLLRTLVEHCDPEAIMITETNIPNRENLSYFGSGNEAHIVYNFSLPPLLLHALVSGNCAYLRGWSMAMPPARDGTAYLNFIASHDGIGLRPAEGLLTDEEIDQLAQLMTRNGGRVSWRSVGTDTMRPYELNIALYDALQGTLANGDDGFQYARFICAHTIMLALEGIPALYIHSLFGTTNDYQRMERSGQSRAINRHQWELEALKAELEDTQSHHARVFGEIKHLLAVRRYQPAFHPNATQFTLQHGNQVFAFWRQSRNREQSIFCLHNISDRTVAVDLKDMNLTDQEEWFDLVTQAQHHDIAGTVSLQPYQCVWLSNKLYAATLNA